MRRMLGLLAVNFFCLLLIPMAGWAQHTRTPATTTPIKHIVVIFDENISFDHYFATYPNAVNPPGEPAFTALPNTPGVNGLTTPLLTHNQDAASGPFRLDLSEAVTCDNDNHYHDEQEAYDAGLLDKFAELLSATGAGCTPNLSMGYYDGNTVTALWNYAQRFAMSDNFFASDFGTTVMGHLNLVSGQTHGATPSTVSGKVVNGSVIANIDPTGDDCSTGTTIQMSSQTIGDLLNAKNITWGWFYGDWTPASVNSSGIAACIAQEDPHYTPFQYYASTVNPHHLPPSSVSAIGSSDQANHQYAITDFWNSVANGTMPAVSFLKPPANETGHPSTSSPLLEQTFLVNAINQLQQSPDWAAMAIIITYDDSDGWYDHVMPPIVSQSNDPSEDALLGTAGLCGTPAPSAFEDRCGYGPRLPFIVISPFAKPNFVDNTVTDQTSITRFIEDNWQLGQIGDSSFDAIAGPIVNLFNFKGSRNSTPLILDPTTGEPTGSTP